MKDVVSGLNIKFCLFIIAAVLAVLTAYGWVFYIYIFKPSPTHNAFGPSAMLLGLIALSRYMLMAIVVSAKVFARSPLGLYVDPVRGELVFLSRTFRKIPLAEIVRVSKRQHKWTFIEIGTADGRTARILARMLKSPPEIILDRLAKRLDIVPT